MSKIPTLTALALTVATFSTQVASQDIVYRDLAAKGVQPLTADEVKQMLGGAKLTTDWGGNKLNLQFDAEGTVGGWVESPRGSSGIFGKWSVNDKHQYCWEIRVTATNTPGDGCRRLFKSGDDLYSAISGVGQDAMMRKLELAK